MRMFVVAAIFAGACTSTDVRPQCHDALTHYYTSGCNIQGLAEGSAEDECTTDGDSDECKSAFTELFSCLNATPDPVGSAAQCNCDSAWESATELCD